MKFHTFGDKSKKHLLVMHGMLCDWQKFYDKLKRLEQDYYLIFPAMNGCYDQAPDFVSFAEECSEVEAYIQQHFDGKLYAALGFSQGATLIAELLARNHVEIEKAVLDGVYVAHQGKLCAALGAKGFSRMKKNGGKPSWAMTKVSSLMGFEKSDMVEFSLLYWGWSPNSMKTNLYENYTYRANPRLAESRTKVYLWCGSKEPYALKSHRILKKYLQNYEEHIFDGYGHGQLMYQKPEHFQKELNRILL